ncbi:MAG: hypothetical protein WB902_10330, partial [Acetobacteraceae bacterium]
MPRDGNGVHRGRVHVLVGRIDAAGQAEGRPPTFAGAGPCVTPRWSDIPVQGGPVPGVTANG